MAEFQSPRAFTLQLSGVELCDLRNAAVSVATLRKCALAASAVGVADERLLGFLVDQAADKASDSAVVAAVRSSIEAALLPSSSARFAIAVTAVAWKFGSLGIQCMPWAQLTRCISQLGVVVLPALFVETVDGAELITVGGVAQSACCFEVARIACLAAENRGRPDASAVLAAELATLVIKISQGAEWCGFALIAPAPARAAGAAGVGVATAAARPIAASAAASSSVAAPSAAHAAAVSPGIASAAAAAACSRPDAVAAGLSGSAVRDAPHGSESAVVVQPRARAAAAATDDPRRVPPVAGRVQTPLVDDTSGTRRSAFSERSLAGDVDITL